MLDIKDREKLYDYFDEYTSHRKEELNQRALKPGSGLLKAYVIEVAQNGVGLETVLQQSDWRLQQIDQALYQIGGLPKDMDGFVDVFTPRYAAFYTTAKTNVSDAAFKGMVRASPYLDHMWLSSPLLNFIWQDWIQPTRLHALLHYEIEPRFERNYAYDEQVADFDEDEDENEDKDDYLEDEENSSRPPKSHLTVERDVDWLRKKFNSNSDAARLFGNLTKVRVPVDQRGRHEYYYDGKVTNRGNEFRGFAAELVFFVKSVYGKSTSLIEEKAAFHIEADTLPDLSGRLNVKGAPVSFIFETPLDRAIFNRFIDQTFNKGAGPFKLWGEPIVLSESRIHVYGLDLHLWQQVFLDMTPERFILVLPKGTCGNTVHRLTANIQRYLDPAVDVYIGSESYQALIHRALRTP